MADFLDLVSIPVLMVIASLAIAIIVCAAKQSVRKWLAKRPSGIAYNPKAPEWSPHSPLYLDYNTAGKKANKLMARTLGLSAQDVTDFEDGRKRLTVIGGATGRRYELSPFFSTPIRVPTEGINLCGGPFNGYKLPRADIALAQALYLSCPTTERDFLALCNATRY